MKTQMKLGLISLLTVCVLSTSAVALAKKTPSPKQTCQTVYVLGGTITTCR
jgi:hypothetical protein